MIFGLGFLLASLCALIALPTVNARATRLARRRIEATLPVSAAEVAAERDHLRAEFAVTQRRLERRAEAAAARSQADRAALGARIMEAETAIAARLRSEAEVARAQDKIAGLDRDLAVSREEGEAGLATLHALEEAHRAVLDSLKHARRTRAPQASAAPAAADDVEILRAERAALWTELEQTRAVLAARGHDDTAELRRRIGEVADALARRDRLPNVGAFPASAMAER